MNQFIDHVFYINLDKRTDRLAEIQSELEAVGWTNIPNFVERYSAIHTPASGIVGCGYSHLNVLKLARERGYSNVLILEDDFQFIVPKEQMERQLTEFFTSKIPYDVCMISYLAKGKQPIDGVTFIEKITDAQTASGYIVNSCFYDKLIELYDWAIPALEMTNCHWDYANDIVWKRLQPTSNWYCLTPKLGIQRSSYSDNKMCYVERYDE